MTLPDAQPSEAMESRTKARVFGRVLLCFAISILVAVIFGPWHGALAAVLSLAVLVAPRLYRSDQNLVAAFRLQSGDASGTPPERAWMRSQKTLFVLFTMLCVLISILASSWTGMRLLTAVVLGGAGLVLAVWTLLLNARFWIGFAAGRRNNWKPRAARWLVLAGLLVGTVSLNSSMKSLRFVVSRDAFDQTAQVLLQACKKEMTLQKNLEDEFTLTSIPRNDAPVAVHNVSCTPDGFRFTSGEWDDFMAEGHWGFSYPREEVLDLANWEHLGGGWFLWKTDIS
jgi:hypothetical protein